MGRLDPHTPFFIETRAFAPGQLEIKRAAAAVSRPTTTGAFEGYASLFGLIDMGRDEMMPGAFRESLAKRGPTQLKLLWSHDAREPSGVWERAEEDARGLKVVGRLNLAVTRAREIHALMREGAIDGLSIGFRTQRAVTDRKTGVRRLFKVDLWEISLVTFPMLPQARVSSIKRRSPSGEDLAARISHAASTLR